MLGYIGPGTGASTVLPVFVLSGAFVGFLALLLVGSFALGVCFERSRGRAASSDGAVGPAAGPRG